MNREINMTKGNSVALILRLAFPLILTNHRTLKIREREQTQRL